MMRSLSAILILTLTAASVRGEGGGVTAVPILQAPLFARAAGMGSAFTALANDPSALYFNPAGLARASASEIHFGFATGIGDTSVQNYAFMHPFQGKGLSGYGHSSLGAQLMYSDNGSIEVNRLNTNGSLASSEKIGAGSDLALTLGYAERIGSNSWEERFLTRQIDHYVGISGKLIRSTIVRETAHTVAMDAGYLAAFPDYGLSAGVSMLNFGGNLRYIDASEPLPSMLRAGVGWQGDLRADQYLSAAADGEYLTHERQWHANLGAEYYWDRTYGLRFGYQFHRGDAGLTVGFGLRWQGRYLVDYAWGLTSVLRDSHRISLSYRFDPGRGAGRRRDLDSESGTPAGSKPYLIDPASTKPRSLPPAKNTPARTRPSKPSEWIY